MKNCRGVRRGGLCALLGFNQRHPWNQRESAIQTTLNSKGHPIARMALSVSPPGALNIVSSIGPEFRDQINPGGISGGSADFKSIGIPVWRLRMRPAAPHPAPRPRPRLKFPQLSILTRHSMGHHRRNL